MGENIKKAKKAQKAQQEAQAAQQERPTINIPFTIEQYQLVDAMISMAMQRGEKKLLLPLAQLHLTMQQHGAAFEKEMQRKAVLKEMEDEKDKDGDDKTEKKNAKLKDDVEKAVGKKPANDAGKGSESTETDDDEDGDEE